MSTPDLDHAGARIMLVEDDSTLLTTLAAALETQAYEVLRFEDGGEAMAALESSLDVVITDVNLPGATGPEILRAVNARIPGTRVVVMTGQADIDTAVTCMREGAVDFLRKPFEVFELLQATRSALETRQMLQTNELHRLGQAVLDGRDIDRLPELIVELAREVLDVDGMALFLPGQGEGLCCYESSGEFDAAGTDYWTGDQERVCELLQGSEPLLLGGGKLPDSPGPSRLIFPLQGSEELYGALYFTRNLDGRPISAAEVSRVALFATHVVLALENSARVRRLITADRLVTIGELSASMTHEVNNALAYMVSNLAFLGEGLSSLDRLSAQDEQGPHAALGSWLKEMGDDIIPELAQAARESVEGAQRVAGVIRDMRLLTHVDQETDGAIDIQACVESAIRLVSSTMVPHVQVTRLGESPTLVIGNPGLLTQIFVNLLLNASQAIESSREGSIVEIFLEASEETVTVAVRDDGPGIPPHLAKRIFEPFLTTKPAGKGTGLGLSISREIAQRHGGTLRVCSEPGVGTSFELELPRADKEEL